MTRKAYDSDLTDEQWKILKPLMEDRHPLGWGRPRTVDTREVVNAICYLDKTGCQWRSQPHDFPPWPVVFYYFNKLRHTGNKKGLHQCNPLLFMVPRAGIEPAWPLSRGILSPATWSLPASNGSRKISQIIDNYSLHSPLKSTKIHP